MNALHPHTRIESAVQFIDQFSEIHTSLRFVENGQLLTVELELHVNHLHIDAIHIRSQMNGKL